ncbi:MAG: UDP-N-acetylglucosamine 2-epimerase (hydrolyzing) [Candidatus Niyogibacteria bacterium CG10_big_fil_rev_8_21_14_0_10_46_36]|uniref:UDP-N-acetylglucosamine 2-epimerase (Hydrolyzing) n=1 Tax=Candidatus Niyogibacteria bacterium CG10_big_fil_rev_8_21_14_0_10_46_36 TaxID=1974726 RepID=A0A2H0TEE9_9BACT|nr:MAG: UDP-N-acetylglucosamine 2-epimerase (hydrolyzing) [Candidatus Niyogibacteria bacterium CG10_big_fil_rev_8_21_14_0_10_46_36]
MNKKRKICFVITSFIHYSRNFLILEELRRRDDTELHIIVGGAALLPKYLSKFTNIKEELRRGGFTHIHDAYFNLEGSDGITKAKTAGLGTIEFSTIFGAIQPDLVLVRGDRFEVLAAATAAAYMNIPVAHIEGGDVSGTLDESVRHAITKLAHIHFTTNEDARKRVICMGERPEYVFNFGSPDVELVHKAATDSADVIDFDETGSGARIAFNNDFLMVMYHPVSTEVGTLGEKTRMLLEAVHETGMPALWFWPNFDAGAEEISHELRRFRDTAEGHTIRFTRYLPPKVFLALLKNTKMLIGNSSAGIKECSYLGVPVVMTGTRQNGRLRSENVVEVSDTKEDIKKAIQKQMTHGRYPASSMYHGENTAERIAETLATVPLYIQKTFHEQEP